MKKLMICLVVGAFALSLAGVSSATDVNIYGASAQYNFWSKLASTWMQNTLGCNAPTTLSVDTTSSSSAVHDNVPSGVYYHGAKYFIATSTSCSAVSDGNLTIRIAAYDSMDGINALLGNTNPVDVMGCKGIQRTQLNTVAGGNAANNFKCYDTHLGASDVNSGARDHPAD